MFIINLLSFQNKNIDHQNIFHMKADQSTINNYHTHLSRFLDVKLHGMIFVFEIEEKLFFFN